MRFFLSALACLLLSTPSFAACFSNVAEWQAQRDSLPAQFQSGSMYGIANHHEVLGLYGGFSIVPEAGNFHMHLEGEWHGEPLLKDGTLTSVCVGFGKIKGVLQTADGKTETVTMQLNDNKIIVFAVEECDLVDAQAYQSFMSSLQHH